MERSYVFNIYLNRYKFSCEIPDSYPYEPPKIHCDTKIYHPNINLEGNVCLNILRSEWNPVNDISTVIYGLLFLFYEPNEEHPHNKEAGVELLRDRHAFEENVKKSLRGGSININGKIVSFPKLLP